MILSQMIISREFKVEDIVVREYTHPSLHTLGYYASVTLGDGWFVDYYGETPNEAKANLIVYITGGKYAEDRNS